MHIRGRLERFVIGEVKLNYCVLFEALTYPVAQTEHANQVTGVGRQLGEFRGTRIRLENLCSYLKFLFKRENSIDIDLE